MPMPQQNKAFKHFSVFAIYLKISEPSCEEAMLDYFKAHPIEKDEAKRAIETRIFRWWHEAKKPQQKFNAAINDFFRALIETQKEKKSWDDSWIEKPLDDLEYSETALKDAIIKFKQPHAISRFHRQLFGSENDRQGNFKDIKDRYCHHFFYIYRLHSTNGILVRDLLRIRGHRKADIFCNMYQYTPYDLKGQKYTDWHNIKRFNGNLFFNQTSLSFSFVAADIQMPLGIECSFIMMENLSLNKEGWGYILGMKDKVLTPMVDAILIVEADEIQKDGFDINNMAEYVRPLESSKKYIEIKERIKKKIVSLTRNRFREKNIKVINFEK